jgi:hypothetical protein
VSLKKLNNDDNALTSHPSGSSEEGVIFPSIISGRGVKGKKREKRGCIKRARGPLLSSREKRERERESLRRRLIQKKLTKI